VLQSVLQSVLQYIAVMIGPLMQWEVDCVATDGVGVDAVLSPAAAFSDAVSKQRRQALLQVCVAACVVVWVVVCCDCVAR